MEPSTLAVAAVSYLAGAVPSGYLISKRLKGVDIRELGSGNPGAANVYRMVGTAAGTATLAADALKGFLPVLMARRLRAPEDPILMAACGALAIVGHVWTVFLGFRGGKGVATSAGVFAALLPVPMVPTVLVFVAGTALSGHISVGSMLGALVLPLTAFLYGSPAPLSALALAACLLILIRHIPNLKLLLGRT